jgi:CubicO group peptidase (beta-lactamase class C family)
VPLLQDLLAEMVASGAVTAAVAVVEAEGRPPVAAAAGETTADSWFDLGSLTKLHTVTLALALDRQGILPLGTPVGALFPPAPAPLSDRTLEDLLRHRAGFRPWYPLYAAAREAGNDGFDDGLGDEVLARLLAEDLLGAPADTYSDLDFLLYGFAVERVTGLGLGEVLRDQVLAPLGLDRTGPSPGALPAVCPCRLDNGREVELAAALGVALEPLPAPPPGIVQDGNGRFLGGLAAHAGLFAPAADLLALAREWLAPERLLTPGQVAAALTGGGRFGLGWVARPAPGELGSALPPGSFGHTGFPGGMVWVVPAQHRVLVLLTHKASPSVDLGPYRRRMLEAG